MTMALMLFGRFGMEPLLTLAAVGRMKLWLSFTPVRGGTSLLFVAGNVLSPPTDRRPAADCWPTPLLLPLRDPIDRPFVTFDASGTTCVCRAIHFKVKRKKKKTFMGLGKFRAQTASSDLIPDHYI